MELDRKERNSKGNSKKCIILSFVLLVLVGGCFSLALIGFLKLDPFNQRSDTSHLCRLLPTSDSCTLKPKNDVLLNSKRSMGEYAFEFFFYTQAVCVFLQFITVIFMLPHIVCCCQTFGSWCTTCTGSKICLSFCFSDCFRWVLILIDGFVVVILCIISCSVLGLYLSPRDLEQIDGYFYCVSSGLLGITKFVGYIVYQKKVGLPSDGYFNGCDSQISGIDADKKDGFPSDDNVYGCDSRISDIDVDKKVETIIY